MTDSLDSRVREMLERELPCTRTDSPCRDNDPYRCVYCCQHRPALTAAVLELVREQEQRIKHLETEAETDACARRLHAALVERIRIVLNYPADRDPAVLLDEEIQRRLATARRDALLEAAKALCGLCHDGIAVTPGHIAWWHPNVVLCNAFCIHQLLAKEPK